MLFSLLDALNHMHIELIKVSLCVWGGEYIMLKSSSVTQHCLLFNGIFMSVSVSIVKQKGMKKLSWSGNGEVSAAACAC